MKKTVFICLCLIGGIQSQAQTPIQEIIKAAINAADLVIQQIQNETIVLQNAEKELENVMSKLELDEITDWVQKQKALYEEYYNELATVKEIISGYDKLKRLVELQSRIVSEYQSAYSLFKKDKHFSGKEIDFMYTIYSGIVDQSLKNLEQAMLVVNGLSTSMTDAQRMDVIGGAMKGMQKNYDDLRKFNRQNSLLSAARATDMQDLENVKSLYGL